MTSIQTPDTSTPSHPAAAGDPRRDPALTHATATLITEHGQRTTLDALRRLPVTPVLGRHVDSD